MIHYKLHIPKVPQYNILIFHIGEVLYIKCKGVIKCVFLGRYILFLFFVPLELKRRIGEENIREGYILHGIIIFFCFAFSLVTASTPHSPVEIKSRPQLFKQLSGRGY